jgi:hypothetical protein
MASPSVVLVEVPPPTLVQLAGWSTLVTLQKYIKNMINTYFSKNQI